MTINPFDILGTLPFAVVSVFGLFGIMLAAFSETSAKRHIGWISIAGLIGSAIFVWVFWNYEPTPTGQYVFNRLIIVDDFALFFYFLFIAIGIMTILQSFGYIEEHQIEYGEFYPLLMFSITGMMLMASASDLITLFLGIEMTSVPIYILAAMFRRKAESGEGALKYFVMGGLATGFLLYGSALVYGAFGQTNLKEIFYAATKAGSIMGEPMALLGMLMIIIGLAFKLGLVPFHAWAPDAYEGAPTFVTSLMATGVKAAGFALLARFLLVAFPESVTFSLTVDVTRILSWIAVITMTLGNLSALVQKDIKRMLAYSSIAHAGYALIAVCAFGRSKELNVAANSALLFYMVTYTLMTVGAFSVVMLLERNNDKKSLALENYRGLAYRRSWLAFAMAAFMFSLAGMPPFMGFFGKFYVFKAAVDAGLVWLAVAGVINSLISVYYYLYVTVNMYMRPEEETHFFLESKAISFTIIITSIAVIYYGIFSSGLLSFAERGALALIRLAGGS